jgi:hypothetical protein
MIKAYFQFNPKLLRQSLSVLWDFDRLWLIFVTDTSIYLCMEGFEGDEQAAIPVNEG